MPRNLNKSSLSSTFSAPNPPLSLPHTQTHTLSLLFFLGWVPLSAKPASSCRSSVSSFLIIISSACSNIHLFLSSKRPLCLIQAAPFSLSLSVSFSRQGRALMAEAIDDCAFWLPSHFLTDDDFLTDKQNFTRDSVKSSFRPDSLHLPMFGSSSALYSPGFSSETETDQDVLLAELTRKLAQTALQETRKLSTSQTFSGYKGPEKSWVLGTSPQSTLAGVGSWPKRSGSGSPNGPSQVPSEVQQDAWELIYAAAGQVARLKMNEQAQMNLQNRGSLQAPRNPSLVPKIPNVSGLYYNQSASYNLPDANQVQYGKVGHQVKQQSDTISVRQGREGWHCQRPMQSRWGCGGGCCSCGGGTALGLPQSAWPPLRVTEQQLHHRQVSQHQSGRDSAMRAVLLGASGPGLKRQSTGTGVFLPRRFGTTEPRKKPACSTVLLPARVAKALNMDLEEINPHHETASVAEHDLFTGGKNATCAEQRSLSMKAEGAMNHENRLPKDWIN